MPVRFCSFPDTCCQRPVRCFELTVLETVSLEVPMTGIRSWMFFLSLGCLAAYLLEADSGGRRNFRDTDATN